MDRKKIDRFPNVSLFFIASDKSGQIDMKRTGSRIKRLCEEKKVSVKMIQKKLQIGSFQSVYAWFSGKTLPSLDNLYRLSILLGVAMDDMIVDAAEGSLSEADVPWILLDAECEESCFGGQRILEYYRKQMQLLICHMIGR